MDPSLRNLAVAVVAAAALCSCSENRGDPLAASGGQVSFGGTLISGANLANAAVTDQNKYALCREVFWQLYDAYKLSIKVASTATEERKVRFLGNYNGNAIVEFQPASTSSGSGNVAFNAELTFNDYSSNGKLFLGGRVAFQGTWAKVGNLTLPVELRLDGGLAYAGGFAGTIEFFNFKLGIDPEGALIPPGTVGSGFPAEGSVKIVSSENRLIVYPYPIRL